MDKDLDNPMGKLHDQLKHIGEFDVCVKCEFETTFLHMVSKQAKHVDRAEDDINNENKEYEEDQSNEHEDKEPIIIPNKLSQLNRVKYVKDDERKLSNLLEQTQMSTNPNNTTVDKKKVKRNKDNYISVQIVHTIPITKGLSGLIEKFFMRVTC